jgi:hypothetical protein
MLSLLAYGMSSIVSNRPTGTQVGLHAPCKLSVGAEPATSAPEAGAAERR